MSDLKFFIPDKDPVEEQVKVIEKVTNAFVAQGWGKDKIRDWWQTPMRNLNDHCPLEAIDKQQYDLVWMAYDKTMRIFEYHKEKVKVVFTDD